MAVSRILRDLIVRVSGEPLDDGIGYRFSILFFYMKFVSSASSPIIYISNTAHIPPLYELGQMDISYTTYYLRSHYNNLCVAQMGSAQRSVATSPTKQTTRGGCYLNLQSHFADRSKTCQFGQSPLSTSSSIFTRDLNLDL